MTHHDLAAAARAIGQDQPRYRDMLEALARVWGVTESSSARPRLPTGLDEHRELKAREGLPLLERAALPFDDRISPGLFREVIRATLTPDHPQAEGLQKLLDLAVDDDSLINDLLRAWLAEDAAVMEDLAGRCDLPPAVLTFLARMTLRPSLAALRDGLRQKLDGLEWDEGHCPLCGGPCDLARLTADDGARILHCALCGHAWEFERLACPFCGGRDPGSISFFTTGENGYRVDYCENCHGYVKTVDQRELQAEWPWEILEVITWHLDRLAERRGLKLRPRPDAESRMS
ncbi:MAG: formate dehydrogenase accessory protein FdhE [Proteobacteria bacterium]|nr:formate dehydrogenase accessory protein FdhE [Pseudomonadota bacterium]MBU1742119.1 formate dehydrogenase accessory protein FdhE [Pseudomonadota bacterium]